MSSSDVLLVCPPSVKTKYVRLEGTEVPLGLAYLAAYLERENIGVQIFDARLYRDYKERFLAKLKETGPSLVGLTAMTLDIISAHELATIAKEFDKSITIVIGGAHASALPERTLSEFPNIDYVILGEGEVVLTELVKRILTGRDSDNVRGTAVRSKRNTRVNSRADWIKDLDTLPFPSRNLLDIYRYVPLPGNYLRLPSSAIVTSRGCPYDCTFCNKCVFGNRVRSRSAENIVSEIIHCIDKYGIHDFRINDDTFTLSPERLKTFCRLVVESGLDISWNCYSRVDRVNRALLGLMRQAGCYHIKYGVESGSQAVLDTINKRTTLRQAKAAIRKTKEAEIESKAMFMLGIPGETKQDIERTIRFARRLAPDIATFLVFTPLPGSTIYDELVKREMLSHQNWDAYSQHDDYVVTRGIPASAIKDYFRKAYLSFYFRPGYWIQVVRNFSRNPQREMQMLAAGLKILAPLFG